MDVTYFRPRRGGPELSIENTLIDQIPKLFPDNGLPVWAGASARIGAGLPDLIIVSCKPGVLALAHADLSVTAILAFLRSVGPSELETLVESINKPRKLIIHSLDFLVEANAISDGSGEFSLSPLWEDILPEIITIEAKVANWRKAIAQAARNRIFAHKSFIALPKRVAERIKILPKLSKLGIGLLSINEEHQVNVLLKSETHDPLVWNYYYELALLVARNLDR